MAVRTPLTGLATISRDLEDQRHELIRGNHATDQAHGLRLVRADHPAGEDQGGGVGRADDLRQQPFNPPWR